MAKSKHQPTRYFPARYSTEIEQLYALLDEEIVITLAFEFESRVMMIPTAFVRMEDKIYVHGSVGSFWMRHLAEGNPFSWSVSTLDAYILAKSAFHHSVNYRSATGKATARKLEDSEEIWEALRCFTNRFEKDRWENCRQPNESELRKTMVLSFPIENSLFKSRTGGPLDAEEDFALPWFAGVLPVRKGVEERKRE